MGAETPAAEAASEKSKGSSSGRVAIVVGAGGFLATGVAAVACVGPLVAILLGIGGFGWLSHYAYLRVPASLTTAGMLAFGFYWVYRTKTIKGGDLGCGNGLLLIIKDGLAKIDPGEIVEIQSREPSVREDLAAWCRMVGHTITETRDLGNGTTSYSVRKKVGGTSTVEEDLEVARKFKKTGWANKPTTKKIAIVTLWVATVLAVAVNLFEYVIFPYL